MLNWKQKAVILLTIILLLGLFVVPPWICSDGHWVVDKQRSSRRVRLGSSGRETPANSHFYILHETQYASIFDPPSGCKIDAGVVAAQAMVIALVGLGLVAILGGKGRRRSE